VPRLSDLHATGAATLIAAVSLVRGVSLFLTGRPKTPLRVLCVVAFDARHRLRQRRPLAPTQLQTLASLLDLGACANAALDGKVIDREEARRARQCLKRAGLGAPVDDYLHRLKELERRRPRPGSADWQYAQVRAYREAVVRLSLGMVAATGSGTMSLDEGIRAIAVDPDLRYLFRIVMQCQIIDDVLDYYEDMSAGLPGFLTAGTSLLHAFEETRRAAFRYSDDRDLPRSGDFFPLRSALRVVSLCARLVICLRRWREHIWVSSVAAASDERMSGSQFCAASNIHPL
jgi:hypothetical protein